MAGLNRVPPIDNPVQRNISVGGQITRRRVSMNHLDVPSARFMGKRLSLRRISIIDTAGKTLAVF